VQDPHGKNEVVTFPEDFDGRIATDIATSETVNCIDNILVKTLVRMALLAPLCRMANTFECPCSASPPADLKLVSEDINKMSKS
jgi:hypothetical protein